MKPGNVNNKKRGGGKIVNNLRDGNRYESAGTAKNKLLIHTVISLHFQHGCCFQQHTFVQECALF